MKSSENKKGRERGGGEREKGEGGTARQKNQKGKSGREREKALEKALDVPRAETIPD